jgi:exodeoxyribonuclease VII large subunit
VVSAASGPLGAHFFRIGELVVYIRDLIGLDPVLSDVWVSGEIADVTQSAAGHVYFSIKDTDGRLSAVMFRSALRRQTLPLIPGYQALVHGAIGIYEQRSTFQLIADVVLPGDAGRIQAEFEMMRRRLEAEGLFSTARKRPLPRMPERIGIVTSEAGAVIHDMLQVWNRRYRSLELILAPAAVQGDTAPRQIAAALGRLNRYHTERRPLDLIILARGGGSPDELAVFNDERVARAIFASDVPIVSAVGHEVDTTIADLVADLRAPTPSAAAEMVTPYAHELCEEIARSMERAEAALRRQLATARDHVDAAQRQLNRFTPARLLAERRSGVDDLAGRGARAINGILALARSRLLRYQAELAALSPETTLRRGYAVCSRAADGAVLTDATQVEIGDYLTIRLAEGRLTSEVFGRQETPAAEQRGETHVQ